jgi:acetyl-CoA carboxylase biotin carboxyl carrier protein
MKTRPGPSRRKRAAQAPAAAARAPTYEDLTQIVELLRSASQFSEFRLRSGDIEVEVRRANGAARTEATRETQIPAPAVTHAQAKEKEAQRVKTESLAPGLVLVRAPMVGTFYRAHEPGAPPFVERGARVAPDTTVCIIEVMKLMNSIPAGCAGVVTHVLLDDAQPVEYGQALIAIDPDA